MRRFTLKVFGIAVGRHDTVASLAMLAGISDVILNKMKGLAPTKSQIIEPKCS